MIIQKLLRVYPIGWTGNSIGELNRHLSQGWQVKFITDMGKNIHDYIIEIERQSITDEDVQKAIVELNNLSYSYLNAETDESVVNINIERSLANAVDLAITALRQMKRGDE